MRPRSAALGRGLLAGLVAGLLLTTLQALARLLLGVSPPAELLGDRIAPLLTIEQFFGLFGLFGGYNGLKQAGILGGVAGQLTVGIVIAMAVALVARRDRARAARLLAALTGLFLLAAVAVLWPVLGTNYIGLPPAAGRLVTLAVMIVGFAVLGAATWLVLVALGGVRAPAEDDAGAAGTASPGRRAVLVGGLGVAGLGLVAATGGMGSTLYRRATFSYDGTQLFGPGIAPITPNDAFYVVTKNVIDPRVDPVRWSLAVNGAVRSPGSIGLAGLRELPAVTQETTLCCISNPVGGGLESNAMWTGVRLADLITAAGPTGTPVEVLLTAVDGYTDTFSIDKAMEPSTLLAYQMNGVDLPQRHGFPVRLVVPGMFGEKDLKWITGVEVVTEEAEGFYEQQGWGPNFAIPIRSRFEVPELRGPVSRGTTVPLAGTALSGDRGISRVEVSTDDGRTWTAATITYPGTRLSWSLWRHDWRPEVAGATALVVRAIDGDGVPQVAEQRGSVPQGSTGYHRLPVTVV